MYSHNKERFTTLIFKIEIKIRNNRTEFVEIEPNQSYFDLITVVIFYNPKIKKSIRY